jgi:thymidylate synthase (FAD)
MEENMKVKLISYSQPSEEFKNALQHTFDAQDLVAYCARVSNPANQSNTETSERLIRYLIKHKHWSPLEMVSACLEVETTRDIARQLLRHRSFSFQEFSQRYADPTKDSDFVCREARLQDTNNRQNSIEIPVGTKDENDHDLAITWQQHQENVIAYTKAVYEYAIRNGIAKEQARAVLPEGLTVSRLYVNGTLRSWVHYIELRSGNGTQKEHIEIAKACAEVISKAFPMITDFVEKEDGR